MGDGVNIAARLEGVARPGAICLSEDAYRQVKARLDLRVSDLGLTSLKNIAEPMRVYSVEVGGAAPSRRADAAKAAPATRPMSFAGIAIGIAALLVLAAAGTVAWRLAGGSPPAVPVTAAQTVAAVNPALNLSIVVLPFANLSNDPAQDYFADGVTWSLTNDLSRIDGLFVIARNTAFAWKGKAVDARQIGKELGVRYILEGSVQRDQSRVRVTVQLTNSETGRELWGDTFEKAIADVFDLQDEIVAQLANALKTKLVADIAARAERKPKADFDRSPLSRYYLVQQGRYARQSREGARILSTLARRRPEQFDRARVDGGNRLDNSHARVDGGNRLDNSHQLPGGRPRGEVRLR